MQVLGLCKSYGEPAVESDSFGPLFSFFGFPALVKENNFIEKYEKSSNSCFFSTR